MDYPLLASFIAVALGTALVVAPVTWVIASYPHAVTKMAGFAEDECSFITNALKGYDGQGTNATRQEPVYKINDTYCSVSDVADLLGTSTTEYIAARCVNSLYSGFTDYEVQKDLMAMVPTDRRARNFQSIRIEGPYRNVFITASLSPSEAYAVYIKPGTLPDFEVAAPALALS